MCSCLSCNHLAGKSTHLLMEWLGSGPSARASWSAQSQALKTSTELPSMLWRTSFHIKMDGNSLWLKHKQVAGSGEVHIVRTKFSVQVLATWTKFCIQGHQVKCLFYCVRDFHFPDECSRNLSLCHFLLLPLSFLFEVLCLKGAF